MKRINYFFLMVLMCFCAMNAWAQTEPFRTTVYGMNYDGSQYYRIPALATAGDGSLVAIADKRGSQLGDLPNDISVVCRRSEDQGVTWSKPVVIAQGQGQYKGYGDPCVIYDKIDDKLVCIFAGKQGLWTSTYDNAITINYSESKDNGVTWSSPVDITYDIYPYNWYGAFAGSGHGLQLKNGRLMFVVAARLTWQQGGPLTNYAVFSDDHGKTWEISNPVEERGDEAKVVELNNGDILMSIRNPGKGYRKFAVSHDGGMNWDQPTYNMGLKDPACNGDIIRYDYNGESLLLQSLPNSSSTREKVTIYASYDEGQTWTVKKQISDSYSAYSSMTVLPNGQICMLVEDGKWDKNIYGDDGFVLNFVRFGLDWLTGDTDGGDAPVLNGTLNLDGDGRYMRIPNDAALFPEAGGQYTVTCKVKLPRFVSKSNMRFVATRGYEGVSNKAISGYELFGGNGAKEAFSVNASLVNKPWGAGNKWATSSFSEGEWAHLAWSFNGAEQTSTIYIDGQNVGVASIPEYSTHAWYNKLDVLVGAGYTQNDGSPCLPSFFTVGEIDDVRFYKRALSADEIVADKNQKTVGATTRDLVAAYDFEDIQGLEVKDISGNGHNGLLEGFPNMSQKFKVQVTEPDSKQGTLRVLNGDVQVANGQKIAAGTKLTIEANPTEKYKLTAILVNGEQISGTEIVLEGDVTISATFEKKDPNALEYAIPNEIDNQRTFNNTPNRLIHNITIQGATLNGESAPFSYDLNNQNGQKEVYIDATTETVNVTTGDKLNIEFDDNIIWLHYYVYIDYNHDGVFDPKTELVSYSYLNGKNSDGQTVNGGPDSYLPAFVINPDATAVTTRMRIKTDWDSDSPTGNPVQPIGGNGGTIVDFNIDIHGKKEVTYPLHISTTEGGTLSVVDAVTSQEYKDGDQVAKGAVLVLTANPEEGYRLVGVKYNGQTMIGDMVIVEGETTLSAEFTNGIQVIFNQPEGCVVTFADANSNPVESGDYVSKGGDMLLFINLEEGYELTSVMVNDVERKDDLITGSMLMFDNVQEDLFITVSTQVATGIDKVEGHATVVYDATAQTLILPEGASAQVYNAAGQLVLNLKGDVVSVAHLQSGCYVVRIAGEQTIKFIKK